jgi:hypothetical protein
MCGTCKAYLDLANNTFSSFVQAIAAASLAQAKSVQNDRIPPLHDLDVSDSTSGGSGELLVKNGHNAQ